MDAATNDQINVNNIPPAFHFAGITGHFAGLIKKEKQTGVEREKSQFSNAPII